MQFKRSQPGVGRTPRLRFGLIAAKMGFVLALPIAAAQGQSCGLTTMHDSVVLTYPPIAKAAHVQGSVILMTTFSQDGGVSEVKTINGPKMLLERATAYVKGLRANVYTGPRQCAIVVTFRIEGESVQCGPKDNQQSTPPRSEQIDLQHIVIIHKLPCFNVQYAAALPR